MKTTLILASLLLLVLLGIGCERKVTNEITNVDNSVIGADACMECHNDTDGILQQAEGEWENSTHASGANIDYTNRGGGSDCTKCHDHQGFLDFLATGTVSAPYSNVSAIHCFTCHAPHTTGTFDLRADDPVVLKNGLLVDYGNGNLCARCHQGRTSVTTVVPNISVNSRFGPHHSNQADMIGGTNGYEFASYTYERSTHRNAISDVCAGCHMGRAQEHEGYDIGGHSFNMKTLVDGSTYELAKICADTNCHGAAATSYDFRASNDTEDFDGDGDADEGYQSEFDGLVETLQAELITAGYLDAVTFAPKSMTIADAGDAGALWNYVYCEEDQSHGSHNFMYAVGLLKSSINYLRTGDPNNPGTSASNRRSELLSSH